MAGVNKVILVGNLGKDPEIRRLDTGRAVANFSLATSETYKNKNGEKVTSTEWHNIVLWSPLAEIAEKFLHKGNQVYIEGKITTRSYDDKDGNKKYITEVVGREMTLLSNKNVDAGNYDDARNAPQDYVDNKIGAGGGEETDDLPF
jgi:single-strand DNA-binding protein